MNRYSKNDQYTVYDLANMILLWCSLYIQPNEVESAKLTDITFDSRKNGTNIGDDEVKLEM